MRAAQPQMLDVNGRAIAVLTEPVLGATGLFWMPGFKSDMVCTKATELAAFAGGRFGITRFDYSGHGQSGGAFDEGTIGAWLDEAEAVFRRITTGPQVVIGSSMGGYLALLLLRRLLVEAPLHAARIKALVLIAPAWDMTEALMWNAFSPAQKTALLDHGFYQRPSEYGEPYVITRRLIEDGRNHLIADKTEAPGRPVHIFQGALDTSVPLAHTRALIPLLPGPGVTLEEIPDGDHRLSTPRDIARLLEVVSQCANR